MPNVPPALPDAAVLAQAAWTASMFAFPAPSIRSISGDIISSGRPSRIPFFTIRASSGGRIDRVVGVGEPPLKRCQQRLHLVPLVADHPQRAPLLLHRPVGDHALLH